MNAKNTRAMRIQLDEAEKAYVESFAARTYRTPQQVVQMLLSGAISQAIEDQPPADSEPDAYPLAEVRPVTTGNSAPLEADRDDITSHTATKRKAK